MPVIRNADSMNFAEIEKEINTLAKKANDGTISIDEMAGGSFTVSNGGVYGSLLSTPIINPPQVRAYQTLPHPLHKRNNNPARHVIRLDYTLFPCFLRCLFILVLDKKLTF